MVCKKKLHWENDSQAETWSGWESGHVYMWGNTKYRNLKALEYMEYSRVSGIGWTRKEVFRIWYFNGKWSDFGYNLKVKISRIPPHTGFTMWMKETSDDTKVLGPRVCVKE